ncbi:MAG: hypothetical protein ACR2LR_04365 [Hassallia sp.]
MVDYLLHALEEKIDHKANRLFDEIKQLKLDYSTDRSFHNNYDPNFQSDSCHIRHNMRNHLHMTHYSEDILFYQYVRNGV